MTGEEAAGYVTRLRGELDEIKHHLSARVNVEIMEKDDILALGVLCLMDEVLINLKCNLINHDGKMGK